MNLLILLIGLAHAYIPEYSLIATHAAEQHGRGAYAIEQEVSFHRDNEVYTVRESWLVDGENMMRVTLEGRGSLKGLVGGTVIYQGGQKLFMPPGAASPRGARLGDDWLEPLFTFRNPKYFRLRLANLTVTPQEALKDRAPLNSDGTPAYEPPGFIRLSRVGGEVAWAIGLPAETGSRPTLWVEQDQFVVRKYRGADQTVLKADDYTKYENNFWYPGTRSFAFGNTNVDVKTLSVRALGKVKGEDARFKSSGLKPTRDALKLPEAEPLKEFYSRFR